MNVAPWPVIRRRLVVAAVAILAAAYPASSGPAICAVARGWLPHRVYAAVYAPTEALRASRVMPSYSSYLRWWADLGARRGPAPRTATKT